MDRERINYVGFVLIFYQRGCFFLGNYIAYFWSYLDKITETDERTVEKKGTILLLIVHFDYLAAILLYLSNDLGVFIYFILCNNPRRHKFFERGSLERTAK